MSWSTACALAELEEDTPLSIEVGDELVALISTAGEVFAIRDECSHGQVMLSLGEVDGCTLECFAHGSRFDLRTGEPLELPATRPVPVYPVKIEGDEVFVDLANPLNQES